MALVRADSVPQWLVVRGIHGELMYSKYGRILHSVKSSSPARSQNPLFSPTRDFLTRLLKKLERSARLHSRLTRIFLQPRTLLTIRQFHSIVKVHISPRLISNDFATLVASPRNEASHKWQTAQIIIRPSDGAETRGVSRRMVRVFARLAGPSLSARVYSDNVAAAHRDSAMRPVPLVFLRSSHPLDGAGVPTGVGAGDRRAGGKEIPQPRICASDLAP